MASLPLETSVVMTVSVKLLLSEGPDWLGMTPLWEVGVCILPDHESPLSVAASFGVCFLEKEHSVSVIVEITSPGMSRSVVTGVRVLSSLPACS